MDVEIVPAIKSSKKADYNFKMSTIERTYWNLLLGTYYG